MLQQVGGLMRLAVVMLLAVFAIISRLEATPGQVLLLRHAEKPSSGNTLSKAGFERAAALVPFFTLPPANAAFNAPVAIYAQCSSKNHKSTRPVQTVSPLAAALGIELCTQYTYASYKKMVDDINANSALDGQTILICWAHQKLQNIAAYFGVQNAPPFPNVYDRVWVIDFTDGKVSSFQNLPQQLMYGDSAT